MWVLPSKQAERWLREQFGQSDRRMRQLFKNTKWCAGSACSPHWQIMRSVGLAPVNSTQPQALLAVRTWESRNLSEFCVWLHLCASWQCVAARPALRGTYILARCKWVPTMGLEQRGLHVAPLTGCSGQSACDAWLIPCIGCAAHAMGAYKLGASLSLHAACFIHARCVLCFFLLRAQFAYSLVHFIWLSCLAQSNSTAACIVHMRCQVVAVRQST